MYVASLIQSIVNKIPIDDFSVRWKHTTAGYIA